MTNSASSTIDARCGFFVSAIVGFRGMRIDPGGPSDDRKLTGFGCLARVTKHLIGSPIGWQRALQAMSQGGSTIPPWCRRRVGTV
jgi:hypothetical protein